MRASAQKLSNLNPNCLGRALRVLALVLALWVGNGHWAYHTLGQSLIQRPFAYGHKPGSCTSESLRWKDQVQFFFVWVPTKLSPLLLVMSRRLSGRRRQPPAYCLALLSSYSHAVGHTISRHSHREPSLTWGGGRGRTAFFSLPGFKNPVIF